MGKKTLLAALALAGALTVEAGAATPGYAQSVSPCSVNGWSWKIPVVTRFDAQGGGTNYVKLRDLAYILNGTGGQFSVRFDGSTLLTTGAGYTPLGTELKQMGEAEMSLRSSVVIVDGTSRTLEAVWLKTGENDGYLCYKLRDLADALGLEIGWSAQQGILLTTPALAPAPADTEETSSRVSYEGMSEYDRKIQKIIDQDKEKYGE